MPHISVEASSREPSAIAPLVLWGKGIVIMTNGSPRQRTGRVPAPVACSLTDYGRSVMPIAEAVRQWGRGHSIGSRPTDWLPSSRRVSGSARIRNAFRGMRAIAQRSRERRSTSDANNRLATFPHLGSLARSRSTIASHACLSATVPRRTTSGISGRGRKTSP